jgi:3-deoxy-D-manno-octulosonic acid (KDO) 8-phosphate synthase
MFTLIAGSCVIESNAVMTEIAEELIRVSNK